MLSKEEKILTLKELDEIKIKQVFTKWEILQLYFALSYYTMMFKKKGCKMPKSELLITKLDNILHNHDNNSRKKKNGK